MLKKDSLKGVENLLFFFKQNPRKFQIVKVVLVIKTVLINILLAELKNFANFIILGYAVLRTFISTFITLITINFN